MNGPELQALRHLLFFSTIEAATLIAASPERPQGVSERAWKHWEAGARAVPADVAAAIRALAAWREKAIAAASRGIGEQLAAHGAPVSIPVVTYLTAADWVSMAGRELVLWRPHQSVCAELFAQHPRVAFVPFDRAAYAAWLGARRDTETMRARWAAITSSSG